jgi:Coenzyme PQQ synthesis protein D (PqqD)
MAETYIARSSAIAARLLGGEMMIMSAVDSTFFTLNQTATLIWQSADGVTPLSSIADKICAAYEIDSRTAEEDAKNFVEELSRHGILLLSDQPIASTPEGPRNLP